MNITASTKLTLSAGEVVQALQLLYPECIDIARLPVTGKGVTIELYSSSGIQITHTVPRAGG